MSKVSLRVYDREIEGMIEGGRLDESVAHCQHILKTFPMHVETYRLLGKTFLEARHYTDAADIFQRVLMAVPDDFVAQVGMSIIRDDEGKLDDAIWHMERAFEDQPSNQAIQGELRRLYGRRDGIEPPKIRLSRDALANMYSQGELFNQAIAEIRAVLAEDANRPDLQVMLARAYFHAGQKVEAAEMAANLLKKYTYCLDALRILVDVLPGTSRDENTQIYRQRLLMLDPYSAFVTGSAFNTDQVADGDVNLERLEYKGTAAPGLSQTNWASSLGIKLAEEKRTEPPPDWMTTGHSAEQSPAAALDSSGPKPSPATDDKSVPDWMNTAVWKESSGGAQEVPVDLSAEQPAEPIANADIPDWLKSMAPQEVTDAENAGSKPVPSNISPPSEGDASDWLAKLGTSAADANPDPSQPAASSQETGAVPDWLKEISNDASAGTAAAFAADALEQSKAEEQLDSSQPAPPTPVAPSSAEPPVSAPNLDDDITFQPTGESKPLKIEDDAITWLESLAANQGAKEEELPTKPEDRSEELPDWLRSADEQPSSSVARGHSPAPDKILPLEPLIPLAEELATHEPAPSEELPPLSSFVGETAAPLSSEDDSIAWPEDLAAKQNAKPEEVLTKPGEHSEAPPDMNQKTTQKLSTPVESLSPESSQEDITITSWLKKQDVEEALGKIKSTPDVPQPAAQEETPKAPEDLPSWLRKPEQTADKGAAAVPTVEPAPETEIPAWIDEKITVAEPLAPTAPGEWVPVDEKTAPIPDLKPITESDSPAVVSPVQLRVLGGTGMLARIPAQDKDAELLAAAQAALDTNKLNEAMQTYAKLIKKNRLLDEVIHDLREAIYRFPVDIIVWQTLGDASMRANRLQDALDAYTKAEELLR